MFELGKVHNSGLIPQDNKTTRSTRRSLGEEALISIMKAAKPSDTSKTQKSQSDLGINQNRTPKTRDEMAAEGIKQFKQNINELEFALGIQDNILPESAVVIKKDGTQEAVRFSEDGQYKITVLTKKDGSTEQIYLRLSGHEQDGSAVYEKLGSWQTVKREILDQTTGKIGYYWGYMEKNELSGVGIATN